MSISLKDIQNLFGTITKIILSSISKSYYSHFGENDMNEYFTEHQIKSLRYSSGFLFNGGTEAAYACGCLV